MWRERPATGFANPRAGQFPTKTIADALQEIYRVTHTHW